MVNSAQKIDKSIQKMMTLGRRLGILFTALFIAVCCCSVVVVISIGLMAAQGNLYDPSKTVSVVVPLMYLLISGWATWTLRGISMDMAHGESPFTLSHARRISIIGWLFVAAAIGDLLFSPGFLSIVIGPFDLLGNAYSMFENLALPIDIGAVLGAVCCFSISAIWRYGALLQDQTEDLV